VRDLNPVENTVAGMLLAGETPEVEGDLFVIGSGVGRSIAELVSAVEAILGRALDVEVTSDRLRPVRKPLATIRDPSVQSRCPPLGTVL
jgi:nucleoside-diphosphate-sugar epimerase